MVMHPEGEDPDKTVSILFSSLLFSSSLLLVLPSLLFSSYLIFHFPTCTQFTQDSCDPLLQSRAVGEILHDGHPARIDFALTNSSEWGQCAREEIGKIPQLKPYRRGKYVMQKMKEMHREYIGSRKSVGSSWHSCLRPIHSHLPSR